MGECILAKSGGGSSGSNIEILYANSNQKAWANGQTVTLDLSNVDFTNDLVWFEATLTSDDTSQKQCLCLNGNTTGKICGNLNVSGGWHARTYTFNSNGFTISTYQNWGGPNITKIWCIKNALK